ncbi:MAG: hypothetical protein JSV86_13430 [Gemmatimonadota bacterium]|nr:MAG: hypothetical protein JSV86_13430 [Gemmatimonadota bacterium]
MRIQVKALLPRLPVLAVAVVLTLGLVPARPAEAQDGQTFYACYVPDVGAVYMIKLDGVPAECLSAAHVEISWTEGGAATIPDGSITTEKLANLAVTSAKLAGNAVTNPKLADNAVDGAIVADNSLTAADLAANSVGTSEITNGSVTSQDLSPSVITARGIAAVYRTGAIQRGVNVTASSHVGPGRYTVMFNFDITTGYYVVSSGLTGTCVAMQSVEAYGSNELFVAFADPNGTFIDCSFTVVVF